MLFNRDGKSATNSHKYDGKLELPSTPLNGSVAVYSCDEGYFE